MTPAGSEDEKISPEGQIYYKVPPPMALIDPQEAFPVSAHTEGNNTLHMEEPELSEGDNGMTENE